MKLSTTERVLHAIDDAWRWFTHAGSHWRLRGWYWESRADDRPYDVCRVPVLSLVMGLWIVLGQVALAAWVIWMRAGAMHLGFLRAVEPAALCSFTDGFRFTWPPAEFRRRKRDRKWPERPLAAWQGWRWEVSRIPWPRF